METAYLSKIVKYYHAGESPQKIHEKERLESAIKGVLGRIPHNRKFMLTTTAQIFHRSLIEVKNFSIFKLANAWAAIGLYAQNLISQPWRKEFHKLQIHNGYYEQNVRNILIGAEQMLIDMGYKHVIDGIMYLEGPIDPDRVALVSKDCFIANTECQVMLQIYSAMISGSNSVKDEDIFHFREQNICDTNKALFDLSVPHQLPVSIFSTMGLPYSSTTGSRTLSHQSENQETLNPHYQWHGSRFTLNEAHNYGIVIASPNLASHLVHPTNTFLYPPKYRPYYQPMPPGYPNLLPTGQLFEYDSTNAGNCTTEESHKRNSSKPLRHEHRHLIEDKVDSRCSKELVRNGLYYEELESKGKELAHLWHVCEETTKVELDEVPPHDSREIKREKEKSIKDPGSTNKISSAIQSPEPPTYQKTRSHLNTNPDVNKRECSKCSNHNKPNVDVSEMSDESRIQGNECFPLFSARMECHICTLL